jgi:hypothetical protein
MTWLIDFVVSATLLSAGVVVCLLLLPEAPPRLRLAIALVGLTAWIVPWPLLSISADVPGLDLLRLAMPFGGFSDAQSLSATVRGSAVTLFGAFPLTLLAALFGVGLVACLRDFRTLKALIRGWRGRSSPGESLRRLLPVELRDVRAKIRTVHGTRVAAATGWLNPTVWVGDAFDTEEDLRLALIHECWHVRRGDPGLVALVVAIKRLYWWNPLVAWLASRVVLETESACDHRSAQVLGRDAYIERLAAMMLDAHAAAVSPMLAAAHGGHLDVARLRKLTQPTHLRLHEAVMIVAVAAATGVSIAAQRLTPPADRPVWSRVGIPDTPAGDALETLLSAFNEGDPEFIDAYLGAYMPQQVSWELYDWESGVELLDIVDSGRLSIQYVVRERAGEARRLGWLEVADTEPTFVTGSALRDLTPAPTRN